MPALPGFMAHVEAAIGKLNHGNYPTIPNRPTAAAPYSPRSAVQQGHKKAPAKAGVTHVPHNKSKGKAAQAKVRKGPMKG